jgi:hypothetical protein
MKTCSNCKECKTEEYFSKSARNRDKLQSWCKICSRTARLKHYYDNHVVERSKTDSRNKIAYIKNMKLIWDYLLKHPCVDCGESNPIVLEFDHRDRSSKISNVQVLVNKYFKWDKIQAEIDKCDVRCANCHRVRTAIQLGWYSYLEKD